MRALTGTPLGRAALLLTVADVLHALDHMRQGRTLGAEVYAAGVAGWIALALLLVLIARGHRLAASYAAAVGLSVAVGFVLVHVAPHWSALSDPYSAFAPDALSWVLVAVPVVAGSWLAVRALRESTQSPPRSPRPSASRFGPELPAVGDRDAGKDRRMRRAALSLALAATLALSASTAAITATAAAQDPATATIATGLRVPWGIAFLPDRSALVSERVTGRIIRIGPTGSKRVVMRVPGVATNAGEGGLLGLALSPRYAQDRLVYAYLTTSRDNRIVRFRLGGRGRPIVTGLRRGIFHDGGRIAFGPDGKLYAGVGETGDPALAQDRRAQNGKILRMNPDGSVPSDNPFRGSRVWSWGHRNVQGLAWDGANRLWATEFGQDRFDEVNLIREGGNYGWPAVEGVGPTQGGRFVNPLVTWPTSQASPSGDAIVGDTLYVAALQGRCLFRIPIEGTRLGTPVRLLANRFGRLRTVARAPDGSLWVMTSNRDGRGQPRAGDDRIARVAI